VHCDAVQAPGRIALSMGDLGIDALTLSAHKMGGPKGVGAIVLAHPDVAVSPLLRGGGQERRRRAGTENVAAIAGFGAAAEACVADLAVMPELARRRDALEAAIRAACPDAPVWGEGAPRVAPVSCLGMPEVAAETQLMAFDLAGIAVSAGSACSSGKVAASHVLTAMGAGAAAGQAVRVSFGATTPVEALDRFAAAWADLWHRRRRRGEAA